MAKGFTKIDNELFEFLYHNTLNASELKVLLFLIRYTKGFNRDTTRAGYSYIAKGTGYSEESCRLAIKRLIELGIVSVKYPASGSSAQVLKLLYKNICTSGTRTLGGEVQGSLDTKVQELLDQDIKEDSTYNYKKEYTKENDPYRPEKLSLEELARLSWEDDDEEGDTDGDI